MRFGFIRFAFTENRGCYNVNERPKNRGEKVRRQIYPSKYGQGVVIDRGCCFREEFSSDLALQAWVHDVLLLVHKLWVVEREKGRFRPGCWVVDNFFLLILAYRASLQSPSEARGVNLSVQTRYSRPDSATYRGEIQLALSNWIWSNRDMNFFATPPRTFAPVAGLEFDVSRLLGHLKPKEKRRGELASKSKSYGQATPFFCNVAGRRKAFNRIVLCLMVTKKLWLSKCNHLDILMVYIITKL